MSEPFPKVRITVTDGMTVFTNVSIDGKRFFVTRLAFDTGESIDGMVKVRMEFYADIEVEGATPVELVPVAREAVSA